MLHLVAPVQYSQTKCGSYITKTQPDVELLAISLDTIPDTCAEFDAKRGNRDFIICKFLIVAVGPSGFAKVPYKHKNKTKKLALGEEQGKCLYESYESTLTKFYSYEKGDTNKDKGIRSEDLFGVLCPGLCLTFFLREEMFQATKIISQKPIAKMDFVALQVASSNVTGAAAGYLLKLKKIKSIAPPDDLMLALTKMPQSEEAYADLMEEYRTTYTTLKGVISDKLDVKYCVVSSMGRDVFADYDADEGFVICNACIRNKEGFTDEIAIPASLVLSRFDTTCVHTALRILNIALSMDAITLVLQTAPETTIALNEDKPVPANTALCILCDYNKLLILDAFKDSTTMAWMHENLKSFSQDANEDQKAETVIGNMEFQLTRNKESRYSALMYSCRDITYKDHENIAHQIYISIQEEIHVLADNDVSVESSPKFISHKFPGAHNIIDVILKRQNSSATPKTILSLQMRRGAMSHVGSKRKRPDLFMHVDDA